MERIAKEKRITSETNVELSLNLDGRGVCSVSSGNGFFDHMLRLFAAHSRFDLQLACKGDVEVDFHHSAEDIGIALGRAFKTALGDKAGVTRYGSVTLPMDEALVSVVLDLSGRAYLGYSVKTRATVISDDAEDGKSCVGNFDVELVEEFFAAFVRNAEITLHIKKLAGSNTHHVVECVFKAFARALKSAVEIDPKLAGEIPSSKGSL